MRVETNCSVSIAPLAIITIKIMVTKFYFNVLNLKICHLNLRDEVYCSQCSCYSSKQDYLLLNFETCYLALYVFFLSSMQAIVMISKKRASVLLKSFFNSCRY